MSNLITNKKQLNRFINSAQENDQVIYLSPVGINLDITCLPTPLPQPIFYNSVFIGGVLHKLHISYPQKKNINSDIYQQHLLAFLADGLKVDNQYFNSSLINTIINLIKTPLPSSELVTFYSDFLKDLKKIKIDSSLFAEFFHLTDQIFDNKKNINLIKYYKANSLYFGESNLYALWAILYDQLPDYSFLANEIPSLINLLANFKAHQALFQLSQINFSAQRIIQDITRQPSNLFNQQDLNNYQKVIIDHNLRQPSLEKVKKI